MLDDPTLAKYSEFAELKEIPKGDLEECYINAEEIGFKCDYKDEIKLDEENKNNSCSRALKNLCKEGIDKIDKIRWLKNNKVVVCCIDHEQLKKYFIDGGYKSEVKSPVFKGTNDCFRYGGKYILISEKVKSKVPIISHEISHCIDDFNRFCKGKEESDGGYIKPKIGKPWGAEKRAFHFQKRFLKGTKWHNK